MVRLTVPAAPAERIALAERAVRTREPMLLIGEVGTGKLHLATSLHELSASRTSLRVLDAALAPVDGAGVWLRRVKHALDAPEARSAASNRR